MPGSLALSPYVQGVLTPLAIVGGIAAALALLWLASAVLPELVWATVKRLPLHDEHQRDQAATLIASARRTYVLRIPVGIRILVALGRDEDRFRQLNNDAPATRTEHR